MRENENKSERIRIVMVEDHHVVRTTVACLLSRYSDLEIVGELAEGGPGLYQAIDELVPDLLLLDAHIPGYDLIQDIGTLHQGHPALRILVLSAYDWPEYMRDLLKAGALGYVRKSDSPHMLLSAIRAVAGGREWISPQTANFLMQSMHSQHQSPHTLLTPRQLEVLRFMAAGFTNGDIANELFVAEQTVKNHVNGIFRKLGVETRVEAVLYAFRHGLASPDD